MIHHLHHPAFQSVALPLLLSLLGVVVLRAVAGERHAAWGGLLGVLGALAWLPGFDWPAVTRTQKLPWVMVACLGLALFELARNGKGRPGWAWPIGWLGWVLASLWLAGGRVSPEELGAAMGMGGGVLFFLARRSQGPSAGAAAKATVVVLATIGLAAMAATGGSLLMAQLAILLASAIVVSALWAWLRRAEGAEVSAGVWVCFGIAWLCIAWVWLLASPPASTGGPMGAFNPVSGTRVAILALAFAVPALVDRLIPPGRTSRWGSAATVLLAVVSIAGALAWPGGAPSPGAAQHPDDPYLTPAR